MLNACFVIIWTLNSDCLKSKQGSQTAILHHCFNVLYASYIRCWLYTGTLRADRKLRTHLFSFATFKCFFFFLIILFIYLFCLHWVFAACRAWASHCGAQALGTQTSVAAARGLRRCGCLVACGIFPDQGSNLCPLHWQADLNHWTTRGVLKSYLSRTFSFTQF